MSVYLILLAYSTPLDEFVNIGGEAGPPEITFKESFGVKLACVSEGG